MILDEIQESIDYYRDWILRGGGKICPFFDWYRKRMFYGCVACCLLFPEINDTKLADNWCACPCHILTDEYVAEVMQEFF